MFPKAFANAKAGKQRLPKTKILYVTLESTANCEIAARLEDNAPVDDTMVLKRKDDKNKRLTGQQFN